MNEHGTFVKKFVTRVLGRDNSIYIGRKNREMFFYNKKRPKGRTDAYEMWGRHNDNSLNVRIHRVKSHDI